MNNDQLRSALAPIISEIVQRQLRTGQQYVGEFEVHRVNPDEAYTMPNEFCWLGTTKSGTQASVAYADRAKVLTKIEVNNYPIHYADTVDSELFQTAEHRLEWPTIFYLSGGSTVKFSDGNANSASYYVLHGFRPIKSRAKSEVGKFPFIYTARQAAAAPSTIYQKVVETLPRTRFILTHLVGVQRVLDTGGNYTVESMDDINVDIKVANRNICKKAVIGEQIFGSPSYVYRLDAPLTIDEQHTIFVELTTPAWADGFSRDVNFYFIGVNLNYGTYPVGTTDNLATMMQVG